MRRSVRSSLFPRSGSASGPSRCCGIAHGHMVVELSPPRLPPLDYTATAVGTRFGEPSGFVGERPGFTHSSLIDPTPSSSSTPCSPRLARLATPKHMAAAYRTDYHRVSSTGPVALDPVVSWGRDPNHRFLASPERLGSCTTPRSVDPSSYDAPVAVTSARLSSKFRIPHFLPPTSRKGSYAPRPRTRLSTHVAMCCRLDPRPACVLSSTMWLFVSSRDPQAAS